MQKRLVLVYGGNLYPKKLPYISGPGLGRRDVTEWHQSRLSRFQAQMPPACGRARGGSVRGHLGCAVGTGSTDVAQGPLALDART